MAPSAEATRGAGGTAGWDAPRSRRLGAVVWALGVALLIYYLVAYLDHVAGLARYPYDFDQGEGYDVKILKEVIRLRKQDKQDRDEHDSLLEVYLHAIETAEPYLEAAE